MPDIQKVNLAEAFAQISTYWDSKPVGQVNDTMLKVVKFKGEFIWHHHPEADEVFLVLSGEIRVRAAGGEAITVREGELIIIPAGTDHLTVAEQEAQVLLVEQT